MGLGFGLLFGLIFFPGTLIIGLSLLLLSKRRLLTYGFLGLFVAMVIATFVVWSMSLNDSIDIWGYAGISSSLLIFSPFLVWSDIFGSGRLEAMNLILAGILFAYIGGFWIVARFRRKSTTSAR